MARSSLMARTTPIGVLYEPWVANDTSGGPSRRAMANLVEVLPNEPVTPITTGATSSRRARARRVNELLMRAWIGVNHQSAAARTLGAPKNSRTVTTAHVTMS